MITSVELARLAGVSSTTVYMVFAGKDKGRVSPARRQQILELARKHGYHINPAASALAKGRTNHIGLCVTGTITSHAIIGEFSLHMRLELFAEGLQRAGFAIKIIQADPHQRPEVLSRQLAQHSVDGLVFLNWRREILEKPLFSMRERGIPAVASGTSFADPGFTWTDMDESAAFDEAVTRLFREGRSQLALIDNVVEPPSTLDIKAFTTAMRREIGNPSLHPLIVQPERPDYDSVRQSMMEALKRCPALNGVLLTDNFLSQGVLNALREQGRALGQDVRVIGFGDTIFADQCSPRLSHYGLRIEEQVQAGMELLMEQIRNPSTYQPRHACLPPRYIARET